MYKRWNWNKNIEHGERKELTIMKFKVPINHLFLKAMKTIACTKFSLILFGRKTVNIKEFRENKFWSQSDPAVWYKMKWCFIHKTLVSYVNAHPLPQKIINTSTHTKKKWYSQSECVWRRKWSTSFVRLQKRLPQVGQAITFSWVWLRRCSFSLCLLRTTASQSEKETT